MPPGLEASMSEVVGRKKARLAGNAEELGAQVWLA